MHLLTKIYCSDLILNNLIIKKCHNAASQLMLKPLTAGIEPTCGYQLC